jgi:hypothetical protein
MEHHSVSANCRPGCLLQAAVQPAVQPDTAPLGHFVPDFGRKRKNKRQPYAMSAADGTNIGNASRGEACAERKLIIDPSNAAYLSTSTVERSSSIGPSCR